MPPTLSFCLPTANRAEDLDRCLWSIYAAASQHGVMDQIEICISDNCSADVTPQLAESWRGRFAHFQYFRQERRRDVMTNIDQACRLGTGDYLWMFGDDDSLISGVLALVLETCRQGADFIHTAAITFNRRGNGGDFVGVAGHRDTSTGPVFASDIPQRAYGYITCLIFRREVWSRSMRMAVRHPREVTTHIQVVADCLESGHCLAIHTPCVMIDKTPSRAAVWNGYWSIVLGYEFFKARARNFKANPKGEATIKYPLSYFIRSYGVLALMRDYYEGIYELADAVPAGTKGEAMTQLVCRIAFGPKAVRTLLVGLLQKTSGKFRERMKFLAALKADEQV